MLVSIWIAFMLVLGANAELSLTVSGRKCDVAENGIRKNAFQCVFDGDRVTHRRAAGCRGTSGGRKGKNSKTTYQRLAGLPAFLAGRRHF